MHGFLVRTDRKIGLFKSILKGEFHSFLRFEEIHFLRVDHYELAGIFQARVDSHPQDFKNVLHLCCHD